MLNATHTERLWMRMLGSYVEFERWQWEDLLDVMQPDRELARRIRELLDNEPVAVEEE